MKQAFPDNFIWGAAAASFQIEGAHQADGKGKSVWDAFSRQPGKVRYGHTGDVACDHYHKYREDVALMASLGLQAYRLSISWPRVMPNGTGHISRAGIGFYDKLVDTLLEKNIAPWITLFHWDYPLDLYHRGGWLNPDSPSWFQEYTKVIVESLSDRVTHWMTINEPQCFIGLGHQQGEHAPGLKLGLADCLLAAHHTLLAHGLSVQAIRNYAKRPPKVGAAPVGFIRYPANPTSMSDIEAARQATFAITQPDMWNNTWWLDPMLLGHYPEDGLALFGNAVPRFDDHHMQTIAQPLDFYGVNIYHGEAVTASNNNVSAYQPVTKDMGRAATTMDWDITPEALYWGPRFFHERYKLPIVITENGMANTDWIHSDGMVHDPQRIDFMKKYLAQLKKATTDGVPVAGYFYWSIMDNFEWAWGYDRRFGLIYVDYKTGTRTLKDSADWYKGVIENHGIEI